MESDWLMVILFIMYYIQIGNNRRKIKVGSINPFSEPQWGQNPLNPQMWLFYRYRKFTSFSP